MTVWKGILRFCLVALAVIPIAAGGGSLAQQQRVAANPDSLPGAEARAYKTVGETKLMLHVFQPADRKAEAASPMHHVRNGAPPTIIFHGTADTTVPISQAERFCAEMKKLGKSVRANSL